jgi:Flp pilus assembly protein TadG
MRRRDHRGAAAVEFALVLVPLLLPVLAGVVDLGTAIVLRAQLQEAAQEGVTLVSRQPQQPAVARQRAKEVVSATTLTDADVDITCVGGANGRPRVTVTHIHKTIVLKLVIPHDLTVSASMTADRLSTDACKELVS